MRLKSKVEKISFFLGATERKYSRLFAVQEIAQSVRLQWVFMAVAFMSLLDLRYYARSPNQFVSMQIPYRLTCWPYFPKCQDSFRFLALPDSYAYSVAMAAILGLFLLALSSIVKKKWARAHFFLAVVILWQFVFHFVLVDYDSINTDLLYLLPAFALLWTRHKITNLRIVTALLFLLMAATKIQDGWILGTYFSSTLLGIPVFPKIITPVLTNAALLGSLLFPVGLLADNKKWRSISFWGLTFLFTFAISYKGYFQPLCGLIPLWSVFGGSDFLENRSPAENQGGLSWGGWILVLLLCVAKALPLMSAGDPLYTFAGVDYSFHNMESNDQCANSVEKLDGDGHIIAHWIKRSKRPDVHCNPGAYLQELQNENCPSIGQGRLAWKLAISRNGGPFYEIIQEPNACTLQYHPFSGNSWIHDPAGKAPIAGYPEKNAFYDYDLDTGKVKILTVPSEEAFTYPFLKFYLQILCQIYWLVWFACLIFLLAKKSNRKFFIGKD